VILSSRCYIKKNQQRWATTENVLQRDMKTQQFGLTKDHLNKFFSMLISKEHCMLQLMSEQTFF